MKKGSYLTIQDWMVTDLHLKGNELLAYALIYGFSQDEQSCFYGSYQYVMEWLSVDKTTAQMAGERGQRDCQPVCNQHHPCLPGGI